MKCEYCDNEIQQGVMRCPCCGATLQSQDTNIIVSSKAVPCSTENSNEPTDTRKSRVAYILLGVFLGGLGIHNFYAGRLNRALGQLLTTVLTGWLIFPILAVAIWVLVDVCVITTDGEGRKFM